MITTRIIRIIINNKVRPQNLLNLMSYRTNRTVNINEGKSIPEPWKSVEIKMMCQTRFGQGILKRDFI